MAKKNTIIMIHGRGLKPPKQDLEALWKEALFFAVKRDHPSKLKLLEKARIEFVYYGHYSNAFLTGKSELPDSDIKDREDALFRLTRYRANEFTEKNYKTLPGYSPRSEAISSGIGAIVQKLHVGRQMVALYARDLREYWDSDVRFGKKVRAKLADPLRQAMDRKNRILVISHSLGSMIAYDVFWMFSRSGQYKDTRYADRKINKWITLGSPLGEETAQNALMGSDAQGLEKFPSNIGAWLNICAVDDYICGQSCIYEQYRQMIEHGLIESIQDKQIYNLAVRAGKSSPHSATGYLSHPEVSHAVSNWL